MGAGTAQHGPLMCIHGFHEPDHRYSCLRRPPHFKQGPRIGTVEERKDAVTLPQGGQVSLSDFVPSESDVVKGENTLRPRCMSAARTCRMSWRSAMLKNGPAR